MLEIEHKVSGFGTSPFDEMKASIIKSLRSVRCRQHHRTLKVIPEGKDLIMRACCQEFIDQALSNLIYILKKAT